MLRRCILQVASRSSVSRVPLRNTTQVPSYLSSRRAFSVSQENQAHKPGPPSNTPEPKSSIPKIITGGLALGSVFLAYYYVLDPYLAGEQQRVTEELNPRTDAKDTQKSLGLDATYQAINESNSILRNSLPESDTSISKPDHTERDVETHSEVNPQEDSINSDADNNIHVKDAEWMQDNVDHLKERDLPSVLQNSIASDNANNKPADESSIVNNPDVNPGEEQGKSIEMTPTITPANEIRAGTEIESVPTEQIRADSIQETLDRGAQEHSSLLDDYYLRENSEKLPAAFSSKDKDIISSVEDSYDGYRSKDGKLVLDLLEAIHAAEERQAELDYRLFVEEKRAMKERYEKELKDTRARELMYAEREAILDKELIKERTKAAAALKSLQEKLEEKLKTELEQKEMEAEQKLAKLQDIAKAELAAAIAREKASQIEKMAEADLNINALCMAFYARSEEARQSYSVHKLALGALALEDALSTGMPTEKEIEALHTDLENIDKDSLVALVLASLPEETQKHGTDTLPQLNHKFDALKGTLRHFSLIPPGGGGILTHSLAHIASWLKVKEADQSGDGVESLINRVESLLAQGKLIEAADTLEDGVRGSQASEVVNDWVQRVRNRAITDQALMVLQSYATSISLT